MDDMQASMLSDRRGDQLKATRKQAAETEKQPADRPHPTATTTNEPTSPKRGRRRKTNEAADEGPTANRRTTGRQRSKARREGRRERAKEKQRAGKEERTECEEGGEAKASKEGRGKARKARSKAGREGQQAAAGARAGETGRQAGPDHDTKEQFFVCTGQGWQGRSAEP